MSTYKNQHRSWLTFVPFAQFVRGQTHFLNFCARIISQAAFLSALVGVEVAEVAASAAVRALAALSYGAIKEDPGFLASHVRQQGTDKLCCEFVIMPACATKREHDQKPCLIE